MCLVRYWVRASSLTNHLNIGIWALFRIEPQGDIYYALRISNLRIAGEQIQMNVTLFWVPAYAG